MTQKQIIIIGSGFAGLGMAVTLQKKGINDFVILEREDQLGGTWYVNSYPGAQVDVPSSLYSLSFHKFEWSRKFAYRDELNSYMQDVVKTYNLAEKAITGANVEAATFNESENNWTVKTSKGDFSAPIVINATGHLCHPVIPDFKGKDNFKGVTMHSAKWKHDYDFKDKKVAVFGTGASGLQIIPELAKVCSQVHALQRTPHYVTEKGDGELSDFKKSLFKKFPIARRIERNVIYWAQEYRVLGFKYLPKAISIIAGKRARKNLAKVNDPDLRKLLTPDFQIGCKRILLSDNYYQSYNLPHVHLQPNNFAEITENGFKTTDGKTHQVDALVFATGFSAIKNAAAYSSFPITGRQGKTLDDVWGNSPHSYAGTTVPYMPNLFLIGGPNTGIGHTSAVYMAESQIQYIIQALEAKKANNWKTIEIKEDVEKAYQQDLIDSFATTVWASDNCQSWYQGADGVNSVIYPGFTFSFRKACQFKTHKHIVS